MRIGIMGGTFDPIHKGHLMLGEAAYRLFFLDEVWFMPNGNPPHKRSSAIESDVQDRVAMAELAIRGRKEFRVEKYEALKPEVSCTYATMEYFHDKYGEDTFFFIIGADSLLTIETWVHPERIFPTCTILAAYRDDMDTKEEMEAQINYLRRKYHADIELLSTPLMDVSSSELRQALEAGESVCNMLPEAVEEYIRKRKLYQGEEDEADGQPYTEEIEK